MSAKPLVSIAMVTYNGERFLAAQLDSLVAQDYEPLEAVVCDDASVDTTFQILKQYAARYPHLFRISRNERRLGLVKNLERAASLCHGVFVAFSDQDDVWHANKIQVLVRSIEDKALVHSDARMIDEWGQVISTSFSRYVRKQIRRTSFVSFLQNNVVTGCTAMIASRLLKKAIPFWEEMIPDQWLAIMAADAGGIAYVGEALIDYRQHQTNTTGRAVVAHASGLHRKSVSGFLEIRRRQYSEILIKYRGLYQFLENRLTCRSRTDFKRWLGYFESFFERRIRFGAFFFHASHLKLFSRHKRLDKVLFDLAFSILGDPGVSRGKVSVCDSR